MHWHSLCLRFRQRHWCLGAVPKHKNASRSARCTPAVGHVVGAEARRSAASIDLWVGIRTAHRTRSIPTATTAAALVVRVRTAIHRSTRRLALARLTMAGSSIAASTRSAATRRTSSRFQSESFGCEVFLATCRTAHVQVIRRVTVGTRGVFVFGFGCGSSCPPTCRDCHDPVAKRDFLTADAGTGRPRWYWLR